jgi:AcrR family transcriptional regulator
MGLAEIATEGHETSGRSGRPTGPRAEARELAILDAALELVMEVGYDRLSMDALAERACAGKATIYRHWSGKAEVVAEAVRRRQCPELDLPIDTGSLRGDLLASLGRINDSMAAEDAALMIGVMSAMQSDPVLADLMRTQVVDIKRANFEEIIEQAVRRGELPSGSRAADLIHEVMPAMVFTRLVIQGKPITEEFAAHLVDTIVLPLLQHSS